MKVLLTLLLILFSVTSVRAQDSEFNFQKAYQDFTFNFDQYRSKHTEYELARSTYLQSKTLANLQKAQEATFNMLSARDEVVKTYLTSIRMRLSEGLGIDTDKKTVLQTRIDTEVAWFDSHKATLSSAESLDDQVADSNIAKNRYEKITKLLVTESLSEIAIGKVVFLRDQQKNIVSDLESKLAEIRQEGDLNTDDMERGILEVRNRITRSETKEAEARKLLINGDFNQIVSRMSESLQYLKEANTYLNEILKRIKYAE